MELIHPDVEQSLVKFSHPTSCPLASGIAMWIKCPDHARELKPNKPDKWWFNLDSLFLNHDSPGRNLGCKM